LLATSLRTAAEQYKADYKIAVREDYLRSDPGRQDSGKNNRLALRINSISGIKDPNARVWTVQYGFGRRGLLTQSLAVSASALEGSATRIPDALQLQKAGE
jgi:hypothetical protein